MGKIGIKSYAMNYSFGFIEIRHIVPDFKFHEVLMDSGTIGSFSGAFVVTRIRVSLD